MATVSVIDLRKSGPPKQIACAGVEQFVMHRDPPRLEFLVGTVEPNRSVRVVLEEGEAQQLSRLLRDAQGVTP